MDITQWQVPEGRGGRLDAEVKIGAEISNNKARECVRTGKVRLKGKRVLDGSHPVAPGDSISVEWNAPNPSRTEPLGVTLVHRDPHLIIIDKPAGLLSAPIPNSDEKTALHAAGTLCRKHGGRGQGPKVVHRLDKTTSGLLLFARGTEPARRLRAMFDAHEITRTYRCVVRGIPERKSALITSMLIGDTGTGRKGSRPNSLRVRHIDDPDPGPMPGSGKLGITRYQTDATDMQQKRAALEVRLATGRTHQIRIHLSEIGHPILGERVYGRIDGAPRVALHAAHMSLRHPMTGETLEFHSPWPADLAGIRPLGRRW
ncbi:MAG: RluA family pseudouridine synthase [Bradymonadia bacterium]